MKVITKKYNQYRTGVKKLVAIWQLALAHPSGRQITETSSSQKVATGGN